MLLLSASINLFVWGTQTRGGLNDSFHLLQLFNKLFLCLTIRGSFLPLSEWAIKGHFDHMRFSSLKSWWQQTKPLHQQQMPLKKSLQSKSGRWTELGYRVGWKKFSANQLHYSFSNVRVCCLSFYYIISAGICWCFRQTKTSTWKCKAISNFTDKMKML